MKKIISLIAATSILLMGLVSCNIETSRSYSGDLTFKVTNLPADVKAVSFWGTPNEWKLANIEADKDIYIVEVEDGTATFNLGTYNFSQILWCQIVPMTGKDMALNDATWWQTAFSGSSEYANAENNLVYDFAKGANNPMTLTLDVSGVYGDTSGVFNKRFNTENYAASLTASWN
jgi:hypothetical protein